MANLSLDAAEAESGARGEGDAFAWLDVFRRAVGRGDDPFVGREILQAPNVRVGQMLNDLGHEVTEVERFVVVQLVREQFRIA